MSQNTPSDEPLTQGRDLLTHPVWIVDCQSTGATPAHGSLIDIAWCVASALTDEAEAEAATRGTLVRLPDGARVPRRVQEITGIRAKMLRDAPTFEEVRGEALRALAVMCGEAPALREGGAPVLLAHHATFEEKFVRDLLGEEHALSVLCTHRLAKRLLPDLPKLTLRAVAGYLGSPLEEHRRAIDHAVATAHIWRELAPLLADAGVETLEEALVWQHRKQPRRETPRDHVPLPREVRLALPERPGLYRMLSRRGDVLYVGKATSLRQRVNSYYRGKRRLSGRKLELLVQVWALDTIETETPLEAALLEADLIKQHAPPYNIALRRKERSLRFANPADLREQTVTRDATHTLGPLSFGHRLTELLWCLDAMRGEAQSAEMPGRAPLPLSDEAILREGVALARALIEPGEDEAPLEVAARVWRGWCLEREAARSDEADAETEEDEDAPELDGWRWTPELVASHMRWLIAQAGRQVARATWLTTLLDVTLVWQPRKWAEGTTRTVRLRYGLVEADTTPETTPGAASLDWARVELDVYDRLSVLSGELKRLVREGATIRLTTSAGVLDRDALVETLRWV